MKKKLLLIALFSIGGLATAQTELKKKHRALDQDNSLCVNDGGVEKCLTIDGPTAKVIMPGQLEVPGSSIFADRVTLGEYLFQDGTVPNIGSLVTNSAVGGSVRHKMTADGLGTPREWSIFVNGATGDFQILEDSTTSKTRMSIAEGGKVGIGTSSPAALFHVQEGATSGTNHEMSRYSTASGGGFGVRVSDLSLGNPEWIIQSFNTEHITVKPGGVTNGVTFFDNGADAYVGIGTSSPQSTVQVNGSIQIGNGASLRNPGFFAAFSASDTDSCDTTCANDDNSVGGFDADSGQCLGAWSRGSGSGLSCSSTTSVGKTCMCIGVK